MADDTNNTPSSVWLSIILFFLSPPAAIDSFSEETIVAQLLTKTER